MTALTASHRQLSFVKLMMLTWYGCARFRYKHMDMDDLERCLKESASCRHKLVVTDGVFSMDGDIAPLPSIVSLANAYGAQVFVDECHATGVLGTTGRGTQEHFRVKVDIVNSTLGKVRVVGLVRAFCVAWTQCELTGAIVLVGNGRRQWWIHNRAARSHRRVAEQGSAIPLF